MRIQSLAYSLSTLAVASIFGLLAIGCGGGSGGSASSGNPASVTLELSPRRIDSGDRTTATVRLRDIQAQQVNGVIIKVRYPSSLEYVATSARIAISGSSSEPTLPTRAVSDESAYLLFYLDTADVDLNNRSVDITFLLEGSGRLAESSAAVDVDAADGDDRAAFNVNNPRFTPLHTTTIQVVDA